MPLDVRGCTRATLSGSACAYPSPRGVGNPMNPTRDRDWGLQLFPMNEEFPVSAGHKLALIKSLPFVHTARRYYRLDGLVRSLDRPRRSRWGRAAARSGQAPVRRVATGFGSARRGSGVPPSGVELREKHFTLGRSQVGPRGPAETGLPDAAPPRAALTGRPVNRLWPSGGRAGAQSLPSSGGSTRQ
ncbi:hypothetical protein DPEC_G00374250 [Dallia pectoralis]|nr:hypothetical protein DPEC_G00374250 [Dallia pectoralis]